MKRVPPGRVSLHFGNQWLRVEAPRAARCQRDRPPHEALIKPNGAAHGSERRAASGINAVVARIETGRQIYRR